MAGDVEAVVAFEQRGSEVVEGEASVHQAFAGEDVGVEALHDGATELDADEGLAVVVTERGVGHGVDGLAEAFNQFLGILDREARTVGRLSVYVGNGLGLDGLLAARLSTLHGNCELL